MKYSPELILDDHCARFVVYHQPIEIPYTRENAEAFYHLLRAFAVRVAIEKERKRLLR